MIEFDPQDPRAADLQDPREALQPIAFRVTVVRLLNDMLDRLLAVEAEVKSLTGVRTAEMTRNNYAYCFECETYFMPDNGAKCRCSTSPS